jgi:hypothetical protein
MLFANHAALISAPAAPVSQARLAPGPALSSSASLTVNSAEGTEGLLRQTAEHLSKMQGGASIGGFPGFEPPDDERYKDKIRNQSYSGEEANYWAKEINNLLRQIVDKNPGLTLEQILQRAGLQPGEIKSFMDGLRNIHSSVSGLVDHGVNPKTVEILEELMNILGVTPWI